MKKTLVAVAALAAVTGAMAEVTISGIVDASIQRITTTDKSASTSSVTTGMGGAYTGGDLNIGGKEDLGNGLTARFNYGFAVNPFADAASTVANSNYVSYLGLSGEFGDIQAGQFFSMLHNTSAAYDAASYSQINTNHQVSQAASGAVGAGLGQLLENQIQYTLPTLVSGLKLQVGKVLAGAASAVGDGTLYGGSYSSGPFSIGYAYIKDRPSAATTNTKTSYGASYDLGMAKVVYSAQTRKLSTAGAQDTGTQYGVIVPFGATSLGIQGTTYSMPSMAAQTKGTGYNIFLKHDLSKRTSFIAQTGSTEIGGGTNIGDKSSTSTVGLWHSF